MNFDSMNLLTQVPLYMMNLPIDSKIVRARNCDIAGCFMMTYVKCKKQHFYWTGQKSPFFLDKQF